MGLFHIRLSHGPDDFLLLSPEDPYRDLQDYTCFDGALHWLFCGKCGVRCFVLMGEGEHVPMTSSTKAMSITETSTTKASMAWKLKSQGYVEDVTGYISVNATTIEPGQDAGDLREWQDKKWICYLDCLDGKGSRSFEKPHRGGMY